MDGATVVAVAAEGTEAMTASPAAPGPPAGWWRAWRARFGLAEVCGTVAAAAGFAAGYLPAGSLLAAAALATICEAVGFYGCIGVKTVAAASRATVHLGGWRRLAAGAWHAVREQLASCAVAEAADGFLIRPGCLAGAAWLLRPLPGGVWLGFALGKAAADVAWYGLEASARRGRGLVGRPRRSRPPRTCRSTWPGRPDATASWPPRCRGWRSITPSRPTPKPRLLARLHARRVPVRGRVLGRGPRGGPGRRRRPGRCCTPTRSSPPATSPAPGGPGCGGSPRTAAPSCARSPRTPRVLRCCCGWTPGAGGTVGDQGKFGVPAGQVPGLARLAASLGLTPYGLAFHVGSQMMDPAAWDGPIRQCARIMTALPQTGSGWRCSTWAAASRSVTTPTRLRWPNTPTRSARHHPHQVSAAGAAGR